MFQISDTFAYRVFSLDQLHSEATTEHTLFFFFFKKKESQIYLQYGFS